MKENVALTMAQRPGFAQLEKEWKDLSLIDKGLCACEHGETYEEKKKPEKLPGQ